MVNINALTQAQQIHNKKLNGDMATNYLKYIKLNWWEISLPSNSFHTHHSIKQQGASVKIQKLAHY